jgi:GNAT superfamily N-acetyltransferase
VTPGEILALFDATMRRDPAAAAGVRYERVGSVVRSVGLWNLVLAWDLPDADAAAVAVAEQAAYARAAGLELEWKLYAHDRPAGLASLLEREGFVPDESETLMVLDLNAAAGAGTDVALRDGVEIRRVVDEAGIDDFVAVTTAAFGRDDLWKAPGYVSMLADSTVELFVVYRDGRPVSSGRLNLPEGRVFASMWGGSTVAEHRGLGLYRALVARRAGVARQRGFRYLTTDARETSRPILERVGFVPLTGITGWVLTP